MKKKKIIKKICFLLLFLLILVCSVYVYYWFQATDRACKLKALCNSLLNYARSNNENLPDAQQWGNLLIEGDFLSPEYFIDEETKYAMNVNASGMKLNDLPNDMVLLFEAKGPKNLSGGPELIKAQKHKWPGCAVQFGYIVDNINFIKKKDVEDLRWEP